MFHMFHHFHQENLGAFSRASLGPPLDKQQLHVPSEERIQYIEPENEGEKTWRKPSTSSTKLRLPSKTMEA